MPVMIANVVAIASIKIDSLMLYAMVSEVEYGIFSAVLKLSESWYFIPTILALVISPQLVRWKESSDFLYYDYLVKLLVAGAVLSIVIALITGHFSNRILNLLYGYEFSGGGSVLAI
jgi:PST family polysaccharide transporter